MNVSYGLKSFVNFVIGAVNALLGLRFILKLFAANPDNGFVNWVYDTSGEVLAPFQTIFTPQNLDGGITIEFSTLFAIIVYGIIGMVAVAAIDALSAPAKSKKSRK